jgi:predicted pyridoxine 5'-phosphate oxidase superfamily flavin-nucleotide-binding protein
VTSPRTWPFHQGEVQTQERAGVRGMTERVGGFVRSTMPDQHRDLFEQLPYLVIGALDDAGRPFASMAVGVPGFIESPSPGTLVVHATLAEDDPVRGGLREGAPIGLLGIEFETRRRNRANGTLAHVEPGMFAVDVEQSTGNCPQYIQARSIETAVRRPSETQREGPRLSARARAIVAGADTTFIASASAEIRRDGVHGCDVSHRGGKPGFWRAQTVHGGTRLTMPDFAGNRFFMTLGNVAENPRVGVAFVDFATGDWLSLTGRAEVQWEGSELRAFEGAERLLHVDVEGGVILGGMIPFRWSAPEYARQLTRTGAW